MKEKFKCFNKLLEKALEFKNGDYFIDLDISVNSVWVALREKSSYEAVIVLYFFYNKLSFEDIKVLTDKIIKLLRDVEKCTGIEKIKVKLPFERNVFIDIDKFIKGEE